MMYPRVQIVASPDFDAEIRCDLNEDTTWPAHDAFSLGVPPLLGDPGAIGAEYGFRTLSFTLVIDDGEARALRKQSELARELMREENWLLFQWSPTAPPVWFRCVRSTLGQTSFATVELDRASSQWQVGLSVQAYPFALGELISETVTIGGDPTAGGLAVVLPDIVGDAVTPLIVDVLDHPAFLYRPLLSVAPLSSWAGVQFCKDFMATGVTTFAADDAAAGGTSMTTTVTTTSNVITASWTPAQAGEYRMFLRARGTSPSMTLKAAGAAASQTTTITGLPNASDFFYIDLGVYVFPKGNQPLEPGYILAPSTDPATPEISVTASMASGSAPFEVDHAVAVPCTLFESVAQTTSLLVLNDGTVGQRIDGEKRRVGPTPGGADTIGPQTPPRLRGGYLKATPGAQNVLTVLPKVQADAVAMSGLTCLPSDTVKMQVSYRPWWATLASA